MNVLLSPRAQNILTELSAMDRRFLVLALEQMQAETFPKIRAFLRSDKAAENGLMIRKIGAFEVLYQFLENPDETALLVVGIHSDK